VDEISPWTTLSGSLSQDEESGSLRECPHLKIEIWGTRPNVLSLKLETELRHVAWMPTRRKQQIPPLPLRLASLAQGPVGMTNCINNFRDRSVGDAYVGDVDAEGGGEGDLVVLLLEEDLADLLGGGELAEFVALLDAASVLAFSEVLTGLGMVVGMPPR
jgi:hypothetical protein